MPRLTLILTVLLFGLLILIAQPQIRSATQKSSDSKLPVKLAVVVVFDQLRGDYVERWRPLFGSNGFRRVQSQGIWFSGCYYPYASTSTGPGHSAILSGATLDKTGIINNEWYDRKAAAQVYCAGSDRYDFVPPPKTFPSSVPARATPSKKPKSVGNPDRMLAESVGDVLKSSDPQSKVFGLSLKDRSAILPAGKKPDGVYWFNGQFTTSTYYTDSLPGWVDQFNKSGLTEQWYKTVWDRARPTLNYEMYSGPDDVAAENRSNGRKNTFPHIMTGGKPAIQKEYYEALANSPMGNELLFEFTKECIEKEQLGQDDHPDLLVVSFSSNDLVGHTFGPDSQEVLDITIRSDEIMAKLLTYLDEKVGEGKYSVTITADHGICPMPEVAAVTNPAAKDARRISSIKLIAGAETFLRKRFGDPQGAEPIDEKKLDPEEATTGKANLWIEAIPAPWVYLNHRQIEARKLDRNLVARELADWFKSQSGIQTAYTFEEIATTKQSDPTLSLVQHSFHPDRSGDLYIILKPYHLIGDPLKSRGTTHGSPHDYDRHVPLMVFGPGIAHGRSTEPVTPQHAAVINSYFLGLQAPKHSEFTLPKSLVNR